MIGPFTRRLTGVLLLLLLTNPLVALSQSQRVDSSSQQGLATHLSRLEALGFSGSVLVARDGQLLIQEGYGLTDRARKIRYTPETVFDIGSITKQFTAAAILRLEMQGKLQVGDAIYQYFESVPADKRDITIHHLLTHSSGLEGGFGDDYEEMSRHALIRKALESKLLSAPGARFSYSNAGYSVLGAIVEIVSGQPYETFLHEQLFVPAGMLKTGYRIPKWSAAELAHGYQGESHWGTPLDHAWAPDGPWWNLRANGGLLSTLGDLYKWHRALEGDAILSAEAKRKYIAPHVAADDRGTSHYGYGWAVSRTPRNTKLIAHSGGNGIFAADYLRFVDEDVVVIAGSAQSDFQSTWITQAIAALVFNETIVTPPAVARFDSAALTPYIGTYALGSGGKLLVTKGSDGPHGAPRIEITPQGRDAFEALMGGVSPAVRAQVAGEEARLLTAMEQTRTGNYQLISEIYSAPMDGLRQRFLELFAEYEARLGPFKRFEIVGTVVRGDQIATWMSFVFEHGVQIVEHEWRGSTVAWSRRVAGTGSRLFLPESAQDFFFYEPRTQILQRIGFDVERNGRIKAIVVHTSHGKVRAPRS